MHQNIQQITFSSSRPQIVGGQGWARTSLQRYCFEQLRYPSALQLRKASSRKFKPDQNSKDEEEEAEQEVEEEEEK